MNSTQINQQSSQATALAAALQAVNAAAVVCKKARAEFVTRECIEKKDRSPVTIADFAAQIVVHWHLKQSLGNFSMIAEEDAEEFTRQPQMVQRVCNLLAEAVSLHLTPPEAKALLDWGKNVPIDSAEGFWTLDPIDGTKGFLRGGQYAIALAYIVQGKVELAVLGCPNLAAQAGTIEGDGALFFAIANKGSYCLSLGSMDLHETGKQAALAVATEQSKEHFRFCESVESGHSDHELSQQIASESQITNKPLRVDSQVKYALVARAEAGAYIRIPTSSSYREKIWDHAAGSLIVEEAGGVITDCFGKKLQFSSAKQLVHNQGILCATTSNHTKLLPILNNKLQTRKSQ